MAKEICISSTPHETRLAILEDDQLAEIYYERENEYTLAGSIYNGRVTRVLPGMQSAFVDLGLERDAFLYVTDFIELEDQEETDELEKAAASGAGQAPREIRHPHGVRPQWRPPGRTRPASRSESDRRSGTRIATSNGRRKQLNRSSLVLRFRKHRLLRGELRRLRSQTKPELNAGVADAAVVAAAARAAGLTHRSNLSQFRGAPQNQSGPNSETGRSEAASSAARASGASSFCATR